MWCVEVVIQLFKYPGIRTMQVILPLAFFLAPKPICYYGLLFEHPVSMVLCQIGDQTLSMEVSTNLFSGTNTSQRGRRRGGSCQTPLEGACYARPLLNSPPLFSTCSYPSASYSGRGKSEMFSLLLNFSMIFTHSLNFL